MIYIPASQFWELRPARLPPRPRRSPKSVLCDSSNRSESPVDPGCQQSKREDHQGNRGNAGGTHGGTR